MSQIVATPSGAVRGATVATTRGPVETYFGIPFAAPTTGARRFRPLAPVQPWAGVRDATSHGPAVPQNPDPIAAANGVPPLGYSEDEGLNLAVWTPAADKAARPVIVWIHGGGYVTGSSSSALSDAAELAAVGDVVVVALHYRLGMLGFLHLEHLLGPEYRDSGNVALLDLIAGLEWVRESIRAFGGDPKRVTLMGESAGGAAVATLLGTPAAQGLFLRAIIQSGTPERVRDAAAAEAVTALVLEEAGLDATDAVELTTIPIEQLLDVQARVSARFAQGVIGISLPYQPVLGGDVLPVAPMAAIAAGMNGEVNLLIGTNLNEGSFFTAFANPAETRSVQQRMAILFDADFASTAAAAQYEAALADALGRRPDPDEVFESLLADRVYRQPSLRLLEARASSASGQYSYLFTWPTPAMGGRLGASHALDVPFVFRRQNSPEARGLLGDSPPPELADMMSRAWASFAHTGIPGAPGLPTWPAWNNADRATLLLDVTPRVENDPRRALRELWAAR